uniref:SAM-dependent MTase RsmB/NOP-type domain-containing protein n=1 Tax=Alexandrium andersonii TaxID=327968 RepID=A0A7S2DSB8_9DINO
MPCCFITGASAFAAHALDPQPGEAVLDLCAGPGTKALVLASMLFASQAGGQADPSLLERVGLEAGQLDAPAAPTRGRLVLNEPNKVRGTALEGLLSAFLPAEMLAKGGPVTVTKGDVSEKVPIALQRLGPFDKILVDPPCTDARAQAFGGQNNRMEAERDSSKLKRNAELIELLLRCAGTLLRPGGLIVYCTTSLQERENDEAVRRFLRRMNGEFEAEQGEKDQPIQGSMCTAQGTMVLPNQMAQHGPLYFSKLRHKAK